MQFSWKKLKKPVFVLGPMASISTQPLMKMCKHFGADIVFTPMVSSNAILYNEKETIKIVSFSKKERPVIVQVFGYDSDIMISAITKIEKKLKPDGFDINLGCPAPKIVKSMCGSAFLKDYSRAFDFVKKIRESYKGQLSVKTRLGYDNFDVMPFLKKLEGIGIDAITIHGRTVTQKYTGSANWESIHKIANEIKIPVILNGDIDNWQEAISQIEKSPIKGIMISRAAMHRPWIFKEIKNQKAMSFTNIQIAKLMSRHLQYYLKYDAQKTYTEMRKFLAGYLKGFQNAKELRKMAVSIENKRDFGLLLNKIKKSKYDWKNS